MLNPELSQAVDIQVNKIFIDAYPAEARFVQCSDLIDRAKIALMNNPESGFSTFNPDPKAYIDITTTIKNEESRYEISYHRATSVRSIKERFIMVKNNAEKIKLFSFIYPGGKRNAFIEFFSDSPEFTKLNSTNFEYNKKHVEEIIAELEHLSSIPE